MFIRLRRTSNGWWEWSYRKEGYWYGSVEREFVTAVGQLFLHHPDREFIVLVTVLTVWGMLFLGGSLVR